MMKVWEPRSGVRERPTTSFWKATLRIKDGGHLKSNRIDENVPWIQLILKISIDGTDTRKIYRVAYIEIGTYWHSENFWSKNRIENHINCDCRSGQWSLYKSKSNRRLSRRPTLEFKRPVNGSTCRQKIYKIPTVIVKLKHIVWT